MGGAASGLANEEIPSDETFVILPPGIEKGQESMKDLDIPVIKEAPKEGWAPPVPLSLPYSGIKYGGIIAEEFCACLRERGYAVISIDNEAEAEEFQEAVKGYYSAGQDFFALPEEVKQRYAHPSETLGRDNRGFVTGEVREYVKFRPEDPSFCWPGEEVPHFEESYRRLFQLMHEIGWNCFTTLANSQIKNEKEKKGRRGPQKQQEEEEEQKEELKEKEDASNQTRSLIPEEQLQAVEEFAKIMSSLSMNHYFNMDSKTQGNKEMQRLSEKDKDQCSMHYPSSAHKDTGLLTVIACSKVPGLQIFDRALNCYVDIEPMARPWKDVVIFMGEKIPLFSACPLFPATKHRVELRTDVERTSVIFLLDVSK